MTSLQKKLFSYPAGAIRDGDEIRSLVEQVKEKGTIINVWRISSDGRGNSDLQKVGIDKASYIKAYKDTGCFLRNAIKYHTDAGGERTYRSEYSFRDTNIDERNRYNNHFLFLKEEDARAYMKVAIHD